MHKTAYSQVQQYYSKNKEEKMNIPMTEEVQAVICAVQDYKTFLRSYHNGLLKDAQYDWWNETSTFYNSLDLPEGMTKCLACFEAVISYPIKETLSTEMKDLQSKFKFGY